MVAAIRKERLSRPEDQDNLGFGLHFAAEACYTKESHKMAWREGDTVKYYFNQSEEISR